MCIFSADRAHKQYSPTLMMHTGLVFSVNHCLKCKAMTAEGPVGSGWHYELKCVFVDMCECESDPLCSNECYNSLILAS